MKTVYVLSGGGAKGCFQVGVMKYLAEQGYEPSAIYGTSVGALNAAGYSSVGIEACEEIWRDIKGKSDILSFNLSSVFVPLAKLPLVGSFFEKVTAKGLHSTRPLRKILDCHAKTPGKVCKAVACKTSLVTGKIAYGYDTDADFLDSVQASASIPGIMDPVQGEWVDGGLRQMTPLKPVFTDHPDVDKIVVIMCSPLVPNPDPAKVGDWFNNAFRALDVLEHEVYINDIQECLYKNSQPGFRKVDLELYCPDTVFMDTLDFDPKKIAAGIDMGYALAQKGSRAVYLFPEIMK